MGIYFAYSKFSVFKEEEVVRTTVGDFISGDAVIGAYINGEYSKTIPGKNDGYIVDKIVCDNDASASWNNDSWGIVLTNLTKRTKCNVYFETKKPSLNETVTTAMSNNPSMFATDDPDNNIRYIGANPNNYVYFNCSDYSNQSDSTCEKWRIIGVFNNVTKSDGTKENLVKIIRNERIGNYSWDNKNMSTGAETDSGKNDWTTARLNYLLNPGHDSESVGGSLYYNAESGTCYYGQNNATISCDFNSTGLKNDTTRNAIESVVWSLGGISDYNTATPQKFYNDERNSQVFSGRLSTWTGKIALMYPSDYGYATSGGSTTDRQACLKKELYNWYDDSMSDCTNNNYIYNSGIFQYTLNHYNNYSYDIYVIDKNGSVHRSSVWLERPVKPTLYLKSNISLKSGDGTSEAPYQLNL